MLEKFVRGVSLSQSAIEIHREVNMEGSSDFGNPIITNSIIIIVTTTNTTLLLFATTLSEMTLHAGSVTERYISKAQAILKILLLLISLFLLL